MMKWTSYLCLIQRNDKMEPRLNCKQPRSLDIYLALTLIKKNLQTYEIQDNLKKQTTKEGESSYVPMVSIETKYQTHSEQIITCSKHPNSSVRL